MSIVATLSRDPLYLSRGERVDVLMEVTEDGDPYDLGDSTIYLTVVDSSDEMVFEKSSDNTDQIEITDEDGGLATIKFVGADSLDLGWPNTISIWLFDGSEEIGQIYGPARIVPVESPFEPDETPPGVTPESPSSIPNLTSETFASDSIVADTIEVEGERVHGGILDVRQFGAEAGGSQTPEERAAAINAAIDAAAGRSAKPTVRIPAAPDSSGVRPWVIDRITGQNYAIRPRSGVDIVGDGRFATVIQQAAGVHMGDLYMFYPWLESNIRIAHLQIDGNRSNFEGDEQSHAIQARGTAYLRVEDVYFYELPGDAIKAFGESWDQPTKFLQAHNCHINGTDRSGFAILAQTLGWQVSKCIFENVSDAHIDYEPSGPAGVENQIWGCQFRGDDIGLRVTLSGGTTNSDLTHFFGNMVRGGVEANGIDRLMFYGNDVFQTQEEVACLGLSSGVYGAKIFNNRFYHSDSSSTAISISHRAGAGDPVLPTDIEFANNWVYAAGSAMQFNSCKSIDVSHNRFVRTGTQGGIGLAVVATMPGSGDVRVVDNKFTNWTTAFSAGATEIIDGVTVGWNEAYDCYTAMVFDAATTGKFGQVVLGPWKTRNITAMFSGLRLIEPWLEGGMGHGVSSAGEVNDNSPFGDYGGFTSPEGFLAARPGCRYRRLYDVNTDYGAVEQWLKKTGVGNTGWVRMAEESP